MEYYSINGNIDTVTLPENVKNTKNDGMLVDIVVGTILTVGSPIMIGMGLYYMTKGYIPQGMGLTALSCFAYKMGQDVLEGKLHQINNSQNIKTEE